MNNRIIHSGAGANQIKKRRGDKMEISVRLHSIQTLGTVDGPGIRTVLFFQGCPFRCAYCHNPDTWSFREGSLMSLSAVLAMVEEYRPYYADEGGVTVSGGECLFQPDFLIAFLQECRKKGIHTAIDTSGMMINSPANSSANNPAIRTVSGKTVGIAGEFRKSTLKRIQEKRRIFQEADLILLDLKFNTEEKYREYTTGGTLAEVLETLSLLQEINKPVWIRQVVVPGINDFTEEMDRLKKLLSPFPCVKKVELLPFRKLCLEKYEQLNLEFPFKNKPEMPLDQVQTLQEYYDALC